jgi:hypothetical protein
LSENLSLIF